MVELPIDQVLGELLAELDRCGAAVLASPPGSGKTTRVPPALLDHAVAQGIEGQVYVLQPRRIAARAAARRVAAERGCAVGDLVGYQVKHDRQVSARTRIRFVTEGVLARHLLRDPFLPDVAAVVLDEFHERSLEADLTLAMLQEIRSTVREDLRLVVMSATLETGPLVRFLDPCAPIVAAGRMYEVAVEHRAPRGGLEEAVRDAVREALETTAGDVLVFLPGAGEIRRCQEALADTAARRGVALRPLHGRLPAAEQDAAIARGAERKVVLATNVAETSLTIEGVTAVVDSGLARILRHDPGRGLDRLELTRISRAAAEQRRGRAGRTGPGICYRLWSAAEDRGLLAFEPPEIRRLDLAGVALQVRAFAARDPREFAFFEAPDPAALDVADELLQLLGAIDAAGLTETGRAMLRHPVHPRLARMLEEGRRRGCLPAAAEFAALLSERELAPRGGSADLFDWRDRLHELEDQGFAPAAARRLGVDLRAAQEVARSRDRLLATGPAGPESAGRVGDDDSAELLKTLLAGYPDRVSARADEQSPVGTMATGRGFRLTMTDHENLGPLLLALQVRESGDRASRSLVDLACPLQEAWLEEVFPGGIRAETSAELHGDQGVVRAVHRRWFGRLVLETRHGGTVDRDRIEALFAAELRRDPWRYLRRHKSLGGFLARLAWLRRVAPEADLPEIGDADIAEAAVALCPGLSRLAAIAEAPVLDVLLQHRPDVARAVRSQAPERVLLPSGREARIDYESAAEPFVAARLQEFFGSTATPGLLGGRVPLLLHLLAPNQRPVQITRDLSSFWANVYPGVRRELQRRYPKHAWPEDPTTAPAESRPRRRR